MWRGEGESRCEFGNAFVLKCQNAAHAEVVRIDLASI